MTDETKTPAPERITDDRFAELDHASHLPGINPLYNEMRAEASRARAEVERLDREIDEFALAVGYGERPEGRSGVMRPGLPELARLVHEERKVREEEGEFWAHAIDVLAPWMGAPEDGRSMADALDAALADVERLTRERDEADAAADQTATEKRALSEENLRLHNGDCLMVTEANLTECRLLRPGKPETWCVECVRADQHLAIVAERDAAQKEVERLHLTVEAHDCALWRLMKLMRRHIAAMEGGTSLGAESEQALLLAQLQLPNQPKAWEDSDAK